MSYFGYGDDCSAAAQALSDVSDLRGQLQSLDFDLRGAVENAARDARHETAALSSRLTELAERLNALEAAFDQVTDRIPG